MSRTASPRPVEKLLQLARGELVAWEQPQPMRLRVLAGLVWITRERDLGDHFLHAGDSLALHPRSRTLIQAEREARLIVEPAVRDHEDSSGPRSRLARPHWLAHSPVPAAVALGAP